jgi:uncharacterized protein YecT (DUF1311 family)
LVKAQRTWITFRDTHCRFTASSYEGGSLQLLLSAMCMRDITEQRIKQLKEEKEVVSKQQLGLLLFTTHHPTNPF